MNNLENFEEIDQDKAVRMIKEILKLEQENLKTKKYKDSEMVDKIKNIIEEEVRKCY
ncbi:MAG TPA: hypothetical protein GXX43_10325 [Tepidanaerobacter syntrophicus]|uniref:hypothetical protein n=1 Tax=Tepidanaerobacter syntrophicus TaxID=224999 RepID=UPI001779DB40|nr:hypothetical protein [Tepidanaerobacter syntrophicus]HHV84033.1 hypothetical protein [Tepidanaerobacter syntrophicus]